MRIFWKINAISILYALNIFIPIELILNVNRISRLSGWNLNVVRNVIGGMGIVFVTLLIIAIIYLTKSWMKQRKTIYWSVLLWLPYFILFIFIFASLFPITNPSDEGGPGDGLIILGMLIFYPLVVVTLNVISTIRISKMEKM